jgi:hypothetical protein
VLDEVYFAESDLGHALDGEVLVAVPVAVARCTLSFASEAFPGLDPFRRGTVRFLLAGVNRRPQLSKLLGITDMAYLELMIDDLVEQGWAHRSGDAVRHSAKALRALQDHPVVPDRFGQLFYWAAGDGPVRFFAGPLRLQGQGGRVQRLDNADAPSASFEVGSSGRNRTATCLLPTPPTNDPRPLRRSEATEKCELFLQRARQSPARTVDIPRMMHFSVAPSPPELARLLVRVVPAGRTGHRALVAPGVASPDMDRWLRDQDPSFRRELRTRLEAARTAGQSGRSQNRTTDDEPTPDPVPASPESRTASTSSDPTPSDTKPGIAVAAKQDLLELLRDRLARLDIGRGIAPLGAGAMDSDVIGERLRSAGFPWDDSAPVPDTSAHDMVAVRLADWDATDDLWVLFTAWLMIEERGAIELIATQLPHLPGALTAIHSDHIDQEGRDVVAHLRSILEDC